MPGKPLSLNGRTTQCLESLSQLAAPSQDGVDSGLVSPIVIPAVSCLRFSLTGNTSRLVLPSNC